MAVASEEYNELRRKFVKSINHLNELNGYWNLKKNNNQIGLEDNNLNLIGINEINSPKAIPRLSNIDTPWYKLRSNRNKVILSGFLKVFAISIIFALIPVYKFNPILGTILALSTAGTIFNASILLDLINKSKHNHLKAHREKLERYNEHSIHKILNDYDNYLSNHKYLGKELGDSLTTLSEHINASFIYNYKSQLKKALEFNRYTIGGLTLSGINLVTALSFQFSSLNQNFLVTLAQIFCPILFTSVPFFSLVYTQNKYTKECESLRLDLKEKATNEITYSIANHIIPGIKAVVKYEGGMSIVILKKLTIDYLRENLFNGENLYKLIQNKNNFLNYLYRVSYFDDVFMDFPKDLLFEQNTKVIIESNDSLLLKINNRKFNFDINSESSQRSPSQIKPLIFSKNNSLHSLPDFKSSKSTSKSRTGTTSSYSPGSSPDSHGPLPIKPMLPNFSNGMGVGFDD